MFSLVALAFAACSETDRKWFNGRVSPGARVRLRKCCHRLMLAVRQPMSRIPRNTKTCHLAAKHGHAHCLRMARRLGCSWNRRTCHAAAGAGHTECLAFAYEHGCPTDENTLRRAVRNGQLGCVRFLMGTGLHRWDAEYMYDAVKIGSVDRVAFLHENGCPWTSLLMSAVASADGGGGLRDTVPHPPHRGCCCPWREQVTGGGDVPAAVPCLNVGCARYASHRGCPLVPNAERMLSGLLCMVRMQPPGTHYY